MIIEAAFVVNAPIAAVWELLLDPRFLQVCIPGCESITPTREDAFSAIVALRVGPIKARFTLEITVIDKQPPRLLISRVSGKDAFIAGRFTQHNTLELKALDSNHTQLSYSSEFNPSGRIASFGERILRAKAQEMQDTFLASFQTYLASRGEEA